jgi:hypothetical protein
MLILRLLLFILVPIVFVTVPTSFIEAGHGLCLVKYLFGVECPGCGMTRALSALAHGDIVSAIHFNSMVVLIGPLLGYTLIRALFGELSILFGWTSCLVECRKSPEKNNS